MILLNNFKNKKPIIDVLQNGGLVVFPCETVYGVAVDSQNSEAVEKLSKYKERPFGKPYAIMCSDQKMAEDYVVLNSTAKNLYKTFLPGPVTVISKGKGKVAKGVESETETLGVRIPDYKDMLDLIAKFGRPIVATSANASYQKRPYKIPDIVENISEKQKSLIDLIIDVGVLPKNDPSTVIDTTLDDPMILRQGDIKLKDKNEVLSRSEENTQNIGKELWQKYERYSGRRAIIFALEGEMGAGKTQFTKGLARAMGIKEIITSPTFSLVEEYKVPNSKFELEHFDAWRLSDSTEMEALGLIKMIENKNMIISIEWAEKVADLIKKYRDQAIIIWIKIKYGKGENERLIGWGNI
ncbi:MAG TPA: L-threonylcarbamoyladenylate synthase [Patescibacteria group bacterium]|nr:L-threonylcarbamoyladenylate synthase [Patescibacteria group bacterium]